MKIGHLLATIARIKAAHKGGESIGEALVSDSRRAVARSIAKRHGLIGERIARDVIMPQRKSDPSRPREGDSRVSTTESTTPGAAAAQMERATGRAVDEAVSRIERMESSLTEGVEGLETDVVGALRRMENHLFRERSGYSPPAKTPTPSTIDDQSGYEDQPRPKSGPGGGLIKSILEGLGEGGGAAGAWRYLKGFGGRALGGIGAAGEGMSVLGAAGLASVPVLGGYEIGKNFVPDDKTIDERRRRREEIRNSPGVFHQMMTGLYDMFAGSGEQTGTAKQIKGRTITFKARRMEFKFDRVSGMVAGVGGSVSSPGLADDGEGPDMPGDQSPPGQGPDTSGTYRAGSSPSEPMENPPAPSVGDVSRPLDKRGLPPAKPSGVQFSNPFQDPSKKGIVPFQAPGTGVGFRSPVAGTDLNDPSSVPYDGGSKNSRSFGGRRGVDKLHTGVDIPAKRGTPIYAVGEGIIRRADSSDSKGYGTVVDIEYPQLGVVMRNAHLDSMSVKVGDKVKKGQQIGQVGDSGNAAKEGFTHDHFEVIKLPYYNEHGGRPPGRAASERDLLEGRIDPREWFRDHQEQTPVRKVFTQPAAKMGEINRSFDKGNSVQPQGFQAPSPTPVPTPEKPKQQVIVRSYKNDPDTTKDSRVRKRNRFYKGDKEDRDQVTFSQYMNVEHDEGIA